RSAGTSRVRPNGEAEPVHQQPDDHPGRTRPRRAHPHGTHPHRTPQPVTRAVSAVGVVLAVLAAMLYAFGTATPALANTSTLTQISSFGANPGALQMYDYVPTTPAANAPLVIALHGCTQSASDYYSASGWPKYADLWGFDLVFPQQTSSNNSEDCFDWFTPSDDSRGDGEAASII